MQVLAKFCLIALIIEIVKGELQTCDIENLSCNSNNSADSGTSAASALNEYTFKYFKDLSQKHDSQINAIADDIQSIKNALSTDALYGLTRKLTKTKGVETATDSSQSLYKNLWVIIQRRQEGAVSFYRSWVHYVVGFGNPLREFFIGLDKIYYLTNSRPHELLIKLRDYKGKLKYAVYDEFVIGNESEKYQLKKLGSYSGNAGDYLRAHVGMYFSTRDKDNDGSNSTHCAKVYQGGWWYNDLKTVDQYDPHFSNLNGPFRTRYELHNINITWGSHNETQYKIVQMMLRWKQ